MQGGNMKGMLESYLIPLIILSALQIILFKKKKEVD